MKITKMGKILLALAVAYSLGLMALSAQTSDSTAHEFKEGDYIKVIKGSGSDGRFIYFNVGRWSLINAKGLTGESFYQRAIGYKYELKNVVKRGNEKKGYKILCVIATSLTRFEIDLEQALKYGEIEIVKN
jgi:hypothetical protein